MKILKNGIKFKNQLIFQGTLGTYFETGFEHLALIMYLDDPKNESINESYTKDGKNGPKKYKSLMDTVFTRKYDVLEIISCDNKSLEGQKFLIGDIKKAKADGYRFGASYPFNEISLKDWYSLFNEASIKKPTKAKIYREAKKIAYYGGSFDPIHVGHQRIISDLALSYDLVIVSPSINWMKDKSLFTKKERFNAVKAVCDQFSNVIVKEFKDPSTYKIVKQIEKKYGYKPRVIIGSDCTTDILKWKESKKLLKEFDFTIYERENCKVDNEIKKNFSQYSYITKIHNLKEDISSSKIKLDKDIKNIPEIARSYLNLKKVQK